MSRSSAPRSSALRYLALGDSYTIGTGGPESASFPARLAQRWRARGLAIELRNLGVNGYTTDDLIREELPAVRSFAPSLVTLLIGANDALAGRDPETYRARLRHVIDRLRQDGIDPRRLVVIASPDWSRAPRGRDFGDPAALARLVDAYAVVAGEETARAGARFFDVVPLSRAQAAAGKFAADRLHFSGEAYAEWAAALDEAIRAWELP